MRGQHVQVLDIALGIFELRQLLFDGLLTLGQLFSVGVVLVVCQLSTRVEPNQAVAL